MDSDRQFIPQLTEDGSYTFYSAEFQEAFHSSFGAKQEAEVRYIEPCLIKQLATKQPKIRILDICYGLGYNTAAALEAIWSINPQCRVELTALEINLEVPSQAIANHLLDQWSSPVPQLLAELANESIVQAEYLNGKLLLGDARQTIQQVIQTDWQADAIFLDPFSPPKCPQLWTVEFINLVAQCLHPSGRLATYSCSAAVRTALSTAGLNLSSIMGAGRKSPGTIGSFEYKNLPQLPLKEQEHLRTRAAIPYRDPNLQTQPEKIKITRQQEQQNSNLETTSQWRKRWL
ncbi:tRNA (5-methylaminomethyl-2-thiouridine)(34)-methyltransferase MnmD [Pleurocapsa sp. PCC 7319]|uniref:tRNA (5-methylaminomethyl-2-thiouridine)(34)-methyltransferase MnmD n=1 Tax=Pleurocapsa sp. PCC 7319 TaxID=118161 RepID=UPI0003455C36|nr:MnmC family methyltransferase [Pleurocapsa sp. PCC 7319]